MVAFHGADAEDAATWHMQLRLTWLHRTVNSAGGGASCAGLFMRRTGLMVAAGLCTTMAVAACCAGAA